MMRTQTDPLDEGMPAEIDFSQGTRGAALNLPVYLDADVQAYLAARARARRIEVA
jgi:hypothetical protein